MTTGATEESLNSMRRIETELLHLMRGVKHQALAHARLVHPDLQGSGYGVLLHVMGNEPSRASEVAQALGMDKGAVSRQVQHLEQLGLLRRVEDGEDRRAHRLMLSEVGRARIAALRDRRREEVARRLSTWSPDELATFAEKLAKYNAAMEPPEA